MTTPREPRPQDPPTPDALRRLRVLCEAAGLPLSDDRLRAIAPAAERYLQPPDDGAPDLGETEPAYGLRLRE